MLNINQQRKRISGSGNTGLSINGESSSSGFLGILQASKANKVSMIWDQEIF